MDALIFRMAWVAAKLRMAWYGVGGASAWVGMSWANFSHGMAWAKLRMAWHAMGNFLHELAWHGPITHGLAWVGVMFVWAGHLVLALKQCETRQIAGKRNKTKPKQTKHTK